MKTVRRIIILVIIAIIFMALIWNSVVYGTANVSLYLQIAGIFILLLAIFAIHMALNKYVSKPLEKLTDSILAIDLTKKKLDRISVLPKDSDFFELQNTVNKMLEKIEHTQEAYLSSEEQFQIMFENAPVGIGLFDYPCGAPTQANEKLAEILGYTKEELGSVDWDKITHPDDIAPYKAAVEKLLFGEIENLTMVKRYIKPDGSIVYVNLKTIFLYDGEGQSPKELSILEDITAQKEKDDEILYLTYHDVLTDLYNRRFYEDAKTQIDLEENLPLSVIFADVDGLKLINDEFGHSIGDRALIKTSEILKQCFDEKNIIARIGGDEFCVFLPRTTAEDLKRYVQEMQKIYETATIASQGQSIPISIAIGYETKTSMEEDLSLIIIKAEDAMRKRKLR